MRNELTSSSVSDGTNSVRTDNLYDADGQRVSKKIFRGKSGETLNKTDEINYMYIGNTILYTTDEKLDKATENILDPTGGIVATKRFDGEFENMYFRYTYDARGSIVSILDPELKRVKGYGYDDFGNTTEVGASDFKNEIKYSGMVEDESSGLHYMNARHYNPTSGRFLTGDSYNDPMVPDGYSYVGNNPINYVDPTGHFGLVIGGITIGLGSILLGAATVGLLFGAAWAGETIKNTIVNWATESLFNSLNTGTTIGGSSIGKLKVPSWKVPDFNKPQLPSTQGGIGSGTIPYQEPMLNGVPVCEVMAQQAADAQAIFAKAKENAKAKEETKSKDTEKNDLDLVSDKYLKRKGIDAHQLKKDVYGNKSKVSDYDIYVNKKTGELYTRRKPKFEKGGDSSIPTGEYIK